MRKREWCTHNNCVFITSLLYQQQRLLRHLLIVCEGVNVRITSQQSSCRVHASPLDGVVERCSPRFQIAHVDVTMQVVSKRLDYVAVIVNGGEVQWSEACDYDETITYSDEINQMANH